MAGDALDRILGVLSDMTQRIAVVEVKQANNDATTAAIQTIQRDVNGIGQKIALHEASPGHAVTLTKLEAIETAVSHLKELEAVQRSLDAHIKQMDERRRSAMLWSGGQALALAGLLWKVYAG